MVEDHEDARAMLLMALEAIGYSARGVADAEAALEIVSDYHPHAILIDLSLPRMNGYELARALRARRPPCSATLIAFTGHPSAGAEFEDFDRYIVKPVRLEDLANLLADACDTGSHERPV
ncbi:MAG: response regulator [Sulfurifustaceae bacterium]